MQVLNLDEKNIECMEAINKFTLMDDTFMTQVFSGDLECTKELIAYFISGIWRQNLTVFECFFADSRSGKWKFPEFHFIFLGEIFGIHFSD